MNFKMDINHFGSMDAITTSFDLDVHSDNKIYIPGTDQLAKESTDATIIEQYNLLLRDWNTDGKFTSGSWDGSYNTTFHYSTVTGKWSEVKQ